MTIYLSNLHPDKPDARDYLYAAPIPSGLPDKFDLLQFTNEIEDQLRTNSCTANAGASACEIWTARAGSKKDFSRLHLYFNMREGTSLDGIDGGAYMRDICKQLAARGICFESTWPFDPAKVNVKPTQNCYDEAQNWKVGRYERIQSDNHDMMCAAVAKGYPILIGMTLKKPFRTMPQDVDSQLNLFDQAYHDSQEIGGHAMLVVGYDRIRRYYIVENSWGDAWGNNGYFALPFDVCSTYVHDAWVFTEFAGLKLKEPWTDTKAQLTVQPVTLTIKQATKTQTVTRSPWVQLKIAGGKPPYTVDVSESELMLFDVRKTKIRTEWNWSAEDPAVQAIESSVVVRDSSLFPNVVTVPVKTVIVRSTKPATIISRLTDWISRAFG